MIGVLLVDDHPALRAGLYAVLRAEPGIVPQAAVASPREALEELTRGRPDLMLVDYHLQEGDGLSLCHRVKSRPDPPAVMIYSAYADARLTIPAIVAGADGVANKAAPAEELFEAIRVVSKGNALLPPVPRELLEEASRRLEAEDMPILGMLMDRTDRAEVASVLAITPAQLEEQTARMLRALRVETPGAAA